MTNWLVTYCTVGVLGQTSDHSRAAIRLYSITASVYLPNGLPPAQSYQGTPGFIRHGNLAGTLKRLGRAVQQLDGRGIRVSRPRAAHATFDQAGSDGNGQSPALRASG
jgi:hypothetical protein